MRVKINYNKCNNWFDKDISSCSGRRQGKIMSLELDIQSLSWGPFEIYQYMKQLTVDYKDIGISNTSRLFLGIIYIE